MSIDWQLLAEAREDVIVTLEKRLSDAALVEAELREELAEAGKLDWIPFNRPSSLTVRTLFFWPSQITGDTYSLEPDLYTADPLLMYVVPGPLREAIDAAIAQESKT